MSGPLGVVEAWISLLGFVFGAEALSAARFGADLELLAE